MLERLTKSDKFNTGFLIDNFFLFPVFFPNKPYSLNE